MAAVHPMLRFTIQWQEAVVECEVRRDSHGYYGVANLRDDPFPLTTRPEACGGVYDGRWPAYARDERFAGARTWPWMEAARMAFYVTRWLLDELPRYYGAERAAMVLRGGRLESKEG